MLLKKNLFDTLQHQDVSKFGNNLEYFFKRTTYILVSIYVMAMIHFWDKLISVGKKSIYHL